MGKRLMGQVLGMGSKGNLVIDYAFMVSGDFARALRRLDKRRRGIPGDDRGIFADADDLLWRQLLLVRVAQLCGRPCKASAGSFDRISLGGSRAFAPCRNKGKPKIALIFSSFVDLRGWGIL